MMTSKANLDKQVILTFIRSRLSLCQPCNQEWLRHSTRGYQVSGWTERQGRICRISGSRFGFSLNMVADDGAPPEELEYNRYLLDQFKDLGLSGALLSETDKGGYPINSDGLSFREGTGTIYRHGKEKLSLGGYTTSEIIYRMLQEFSNVGEGFRK